MGTVKVEVTAKHVHQAAPKPNDLITKAKVLAELSALLPDPNPKLGRVMRLASGPTRAVPLYAEFTTWDGGTAQRYRSPAGSIVIRRTCTPQERQLMRLKFSTWWEIEVA